MEVLKSNFRLLNKVQNPEVTNGKYCVITLYVHLENTSPVAMFGIAYFHTTVSILCMGYMSLLHLAKRSIYKRSQCTTVYP